jgi:putative nucleotidyltransferase with HDIG domain
MKGESLHRFADEEELYGCQNAKEFIGKLYVLIRSAHTYDRQNAIMSKSACSAREILERLLEYHNSIRFDVVNDCIFFNSVRLRADVTDVKTFNFLIQQMKIGRIRAVVIDDGADAEDILGFAIVVAKANSAARDPTEDPFKEMKRLLQLEGLAGIQIEARKQDIEAFSQTTTLVSPSREQARHAFFSALHIVREAVKDGISKGSVNPRKVKRVVESVVDSILSDEESVLALTYLRDYDEFTYQHCLNVCVFSIALANRLGLPKPVLCEVGIAALFHDIGKTCIPLRVLNETNQLTGKEWRQIRQHTKTGVQILTQFRKIDRITLRSMVVAFCHHMNLDRTGYPVTSRQVTPDIFSRIVRIADIYDALTSARSYRMKPFSRDQVLEMMKEKSGNELDSVLCSIFADVIGVMPAQMPAKGANPFAMAATQAKQP